MTKPIPTRERWPPELERRIEALERSGGGQDLDARSWFWLLLFGVLIPAALLLWGWWV